MLGTRAMSIPQGAPSYFLQTFGRMKAREVICERDNQPDMAQAMHLISGDTLRKQDNRQERSAGSMAGGRQAISDEEIVRRLFVSALCAHRMRESYRSPFRRFAPAALAARRQAFEDTLWAIFNSKEFLFNH